MSIWSFKKKDLVWGQLNKGCWSSDMLTENDFAFRLMIFCKFKTCFCSHCRNYVAPMYSLSSLFSWSSFSSSHTSKCQRPGAGHLKTSQGALKDKRKPAPQPQHLWRKTPWWRWTALNLTKKMPKIHDAPLLWLLNPRRVIKGMSKETVRNGTIFFPPQLLLLSLHPHISPPCTILPGLPVLSKSDMKSHSKNTRRCLAL